MLDEVWGLVYDISPNDERRLDVKEGWPSVYGREEVTVQFYPLPPDGSSAVSRYMRPSDLKVRVYISGGPPGVGRPQEEYVLRLNLGFDDAINIGMPQTYVDSVIRKWIPDQDLYSRRTIHHAIRRGFF